MKHYRFDDDQNRFNQFKYRLFSSKHVFSSIRRAYVIAVKPAKCAASTIEDHFRVFISRYVVVFDAVPFLMFHIARNIGMDICEVKQWRIYRYAYIDCYSITYGIIWHQWYVFDSFVTTNNSMKYHSEYSIADVLY